LLINSHRITAVTATGEIKASGNEDYTVKRKNVSGVYTWL